MQYYTLYQSDVGRVKKTNQDSLCSFQAMSDKGVIKLVSVCDGMGGLAHGEMASASVINRLQGWFLKEMPTLIEQDDFSLQLVSKVLVELLNNANKAIYEYGSKNRTRIGTTTTILFILNDEYIIVHIGDSRVYSYCNNQLVQLTTDHSKVQRLYASGVITAEEMESHPQRNVLTQCIGALASINPQVLFGKVKSKEVFLLCSDGFRHEIKDEEISAYLGNCYTLPPEVQSQHLRELLEIAMQRNETDNITACVVYEKSGVI